MSDPSSIAPKSIILFADGTGNSASKPAKTNVWRTYQALDLSPPQPGERSQVAFYRDGVGTETFKPMKLVGAAFGFGVMRHVRALYVFLCRNYRPGDRIYAFGFSRGAFTIRLLVGLVARCGIVQADDENQLRHYTNAAYAAYRRDFLIRASKRHWMIYDHVIAPPCYLDDGMRIDLHLPTETLWPHVAFLGLWDTVDAYGMPVEELKQGIDEWIWPMRLADRKLSSIVDKACHALSLDDERPTFRPLLWDEREEKDRDRLEQVWFAGVHANVGGGYAIDDLAYVPLRWMLEKAADAGLRFCPNVLQGFAEQENVHGSAYDSRSGAAGYYRYGPRSVEKLCDDTRNHVSIAEPKVHPSVIERIAARHVAYAPLSLPRTFALTAGHDPIQEPTYVDFAWDAVFWRRITYFVTLALTILIVLYPIFHADLDVDPHADRATAEAWFATFLPEKVAAFAASVLGFVPAWASPWLHTLEHHPKMSVLVVAIFVWLFFVQSQRLQRTIAERSEWAWAALKDAPIHPPPNPPFSDRMVHALRTSKSGNAIGRWYDEKLVPNVVGVALLVFLFWFGGKLLLGAYRLLHGPALAWAIAITFALTCVSFLTNARYRKMIDAELAAHSDGPKLEIPERRLHYSVADLDAFKTKAAAIVLPDKRTLLEVYHGPVLLPNDLLFALALGLFVILVGSGLAEMFPAHPRLAHASSALGLAYLLFDVGEDILLARIFGSKHVPRRPALLAPWMTLGKMACLAASVTGGLLFAALLAASRLVKADVPPRF